jgi:hypothetical protein
MNRSADLLIGSLEIPPGKEPIRRSAFRRVQGSRRGSGFGEFSSPAPDFFRNFLSHLVIVLRHLSYGKTGETPGRNKNFRFSTEGGRSEKVCLRNS